MVSACIDEPEERNFQIRRHQLAVQQEVSEWGWILWANLEKSPRKRYSTADRRLPRPPECTLPYQQHVVRTGFVVSSSSLALESSPSTVDGPEYGALNISTLCILP